MLGPEYTFTLVLVADKDPEKSMARLRAEREDLKLFFQIIMERIWSDRRNEFQHLEKKSRSVGASIQQFAHRAKELIPDPKRKEEVDEFIKNIRFLTQTRRAPVEPIQIARPEQVFARLPATGGNAEKTGSEGMRRKELEAYLRERARRWTEGKEKLDGNVAVEVLASRFPELEVQWSDAVVRDAFNVAVKNAVEAAAARGEAGQVTCQIQASPGDVRDGLAQWFVDIVIENSGGPIDAKTLQELNQPDPVSRGKNVHKPGSTGVGVFLARYQLMEVIGSGADMILSNTGRDVVQTRIRLPAQLVATDSDASLAKVADDHPDRDYVLYVEDSEAFFEPMVSELEKLVARVELSVEHRRGRLAAMALVQKRMPLAFITDLTILEQEDGDTSQRKSGALLLRDFLRLTGATKDRPPVWILSQEAEQDVVESLEQQASYVLRETANASADDQTAQGSICVFSGAKHPADLPDGLLEHLISRVGSDVSGSAAPAGLEEIKNGPAHLAIPSTSRGLRSRMREALNSNDVDHGTVLVVQGKATRQNQIIPWLETWHRHPGIPDRDPAFANDPTRQLLTDHMYHKRLVLQLTVSATVRRRLRAQILYWGLQNNVWFDTRAVPPERLASKWVAIAQETKGPLSYLRHEVRSTWVDAALQSVLAETVQAINECEKELQLSVEDRRKLVQALVAGDRKLDLDDLLVAPAVENELVSKLEGVHEKLGGLYRSLGSATEKDATLSIAVGEQRHMLTLLQDYIGGRR